MAHRTRRKWFLWRHELPPMMPRNMGYHREPPPLNLPGRPAAGSSAPARLVLVLGGPQNERALADCLAQCGLRCIFGPHGDDMAALQGQVVFDAAVLDVSGSGQTMAAMLARVRQAFAGRLVVVADGDDEVDEIMALELGADDFVRAPVSPRRLRARLLALLRAPRADASVIEPPHSPRVVVDALGGWRLDTVRLRLERGERSIALTASQMQLLQCLHQHAGRLVPRAELHDRVCPGASDIRARTIDVYLHRLRRRLLDEGVHEIRIEAVRGRGFVLCADVPGTPAAPAPPTLRAVT